MSGTGPDGARTAGAEHTSAPHRREARGKLADRRALWSDVARGLADRPWSLPAKLLYDGPGAELFEEITRLEEYYLTRTEMGILEHCLPRVAERVGPGARVVEYGSGSGRKTTMLLDALPEPSALVAVDIARSQLLSFSEEVNRGRPDLAVVPVVADYTKPFVLPEPEGDPGATLFFFPGSTIGNFEPEEARRFLCIMAEAGGEGALLLIGVDLRKPRSVLEPAYDDRRGVTAEFNRNALRTLNRRLGGDFEPERFRHRALWNAERSRIEMWLVSDRDQTVTLDPRLEGIQPLTLRFAEGDGIRTEHSYKYTPERFSALSSEAGWRVVERWTDPEGWFAVALLRREG